jgi:hypothetical protein
VNNLSFYWNVFILFNFSFFSNVFNLSFWDVLRNVLTKIFNGIVVGNSDFPWDFFYSNLFSIFSDFSGLRNSFNSGIFLVFDNFFFEGDIFDSAFSLDNFFTSVDYSVNNLRLMCNT